MSGYFLALFVTLSLLGSITCPPVNPQADHEVEPDPMDHPDMSNLEYQKYLAEVVQLLENDPGFKKMLDSTNSSDFDDTTNIAHYLQFATTNTRNKLDELKRIEVRRLRELHMKQMKANMDKAYKEGHSQVAQPDINMEHVKHDTPNFEKDDLAALIKKTTEHLTELDQKRRANFKEYEMNKEHQFREELKHMNGTEEKEKAQAEHEASRKRHQEHPKVHHPGNKAQLEEVWEKEDHMDPDNFDPTTFFHMHDVNGDGFLDEGELQALFGKELDKVYGEDNKDDDNVERFEEMNRMREHVMNEIDTNKDRRVSLDEFVASTNRTSFDEDDEWKTINDKDEYTDDEMEAFEKAMADQQAKMDAEHKERTETSEH